MKCTKVIIYLLCLIIGIVLYNELKVQYYIRELQTNCWTFHCSDSFDKNSIDYLVSEAEQNDVLLYTYEENIESNQKNYSIYESDCISKYFSYPIQQKVKSFMFGSIFFSEQSLSCLKAINGNTYFRIKGNSENVDKYIKIIDKRTDLIQLHANNQLYARQCIIITNVIWIVIIFFLFFSSLYQVSVFKREKMLEICFGKSQLYIFVISILFELLFTIPFTIIVLQIMKWYFWLEINKNIYVILGVMISISIIPYFTYLRFNIKAISYENKSLIRVVKISKIFKMILTSMTIIALLLGYNIFKNLLELHRNNVKLSVFDNYSVLNIKTKDLNGVPKEIIELDSVVAQSYSDGKYINKLYDKFSDENSITIINRVTISNGNDEIDVIYCNYNTKEYISSILGEDIVENSKGLTFLMPQKTAINDIKIEQMKSILSNYSDCSFPQIITYENNIYLNSIEAGDKIEIDQIQNPYIIFDNSYPVKNNNEVERRLDNVALLILPNDKIINELERDVNMGKIEYKLLPIKEKIHSDIDKTKDEIMSIIIIVVLLLCLELIMTYNIILFDYKLNTKEYALKTVLGYGILKKYIKILVFFILNCFLSLTVLSLMFMDYYYIIVLCELLLMISDLFFVFIFTLMIEKKRTTNIIKGGL